MKGKEKEKGFKGVAAALVRLLVANAFLLLMTHLSHCVSRCVFHLHLFQLYFNCCMSCDSIIVLIMLVIIFFVL